MPELPLAADGTAGEDFNSVIQHTEFDYPDNVLPLQRMAHEDLGRLGVFWHTQGSGKSYSMAFFAEKVRRVVPGNFSFVIMTDREDLDDQIFRTFIGCGVADQNTPRAATGRQLRELLREDHRFLNMTN
jgi:type I restriction enzyme R subunit